MCIVGLKYAISATGGGTAFMTEMRFNWLAGAAARSFTSTAVNVVTQNTRARVRVERKPKKKGYLRLHTSLGDLNVELHCDIVPRTCENFFVLAESGYYSNTTFHRSIRNFMIQVHRSATLFKLLSELLKDDRGAGTFLSGASS